MATLIHHSARALRRAHFCAVLSLSLVVLLNRPLAAQQEDPSRIFRPAQSQSPDADEDINDLRTNPNDALSTGDLDSLSPSRSRLSSRGVPTIPGSTDSLSTTRDRRQTLPERVWEPPTEFQLFVQSSTGRFLPIYGASLFDRVPSTFAPIDHTPVTPDYTIGPSDEVDLRVWGQINFNQRLMVDRAGDVFIPQVGRVSLAGLHFAQLQDTLKTAIGRVFKNFDLSVNMGQLRSIQVFVVGQARRPGSYTVSSFSSLVNALFASGGPSSRGSMRNIQLKRNGQLITTLDLYDLLLNGDKSKDAPLSPGDVIYIPRVGPRVAVAGSVETPAIFEIKDTASLGEVLNYAGGISPVAGGQHAILERVDQHSTLVSDDVPLTTAGLARPLQNGDIVQLPALVPRFEQVVSLRGNLADPVRLPWRPGMKVSDAIPDREALLTRDYWSAHNNLRGDAELNPNPQLGLNANNSNPAEGNPEFSASGLNYSGLSPAANAAPASAPRPETTQRFEDIETGGAASDQSLASSQTSNRRAVSRRFLQKNDLRPGAPDIDWSYAAIERRDPVTLKSRIIPFDLGKAVIDRNPQSDLALEPGDIINIFSTADITTPRAAQTRYVRLEGEIKMAGVYSALPGETLREIVARAGGLTPNAYLYGAELTRESTRQEQQQRYSAFLDQLERDINQSGATLSGRVVSPQQDQALQASATSQRALIERLRQATPSGRIVLGLQPESQNLDAIPPLQLENGDRFVVPALAATVNVIGTVYTQSTLIYAAGFRLTDYLHEAGGPTRYADRSHLFVIRADGSVIAKEGRLGLFTGSFEALRMYPGDSIIVPTNVTKTTLLRGFIDWSQVISNFGLGAAAINVLK